MPEPNKPVIRSTDVAAYFEKTHRNLLADITGLKCSDEFRQANFSGAVYRSAQGKVLPCVNMTAEGLVFLASGLSGVTPAKWKEQVIPMLVAGFEERLLFAIHPPETGDQPE